MTVKNMKNGHKIEINSRRGKPILTRGFVHICGKHDHKGFRVISEDVLYKDFEWEGK